MGIRVSGLGSSDIQNSKFNIFPKTNKTKKIELLLFSS